MATQDSRVLALNLAHIHSSKTAIDPTARHVSIEALSRSITDTLECALAARQAAWNACGPSLGSLRGLFTNVSDQLISIADVLAERASALGGLPACTVQSIATNSEQRPYSVLSIDAAEHVAALTRRLGHLGSELRQTANELLPAGDLVTAALVTRSCATVDRLLWSIEIQHEAAAD